MICKRKTNSGTKLDVDLPILIKRKYGYPATAYRSNFEDWAEGNTGDNTYVYDEFDIPSDPSECDATSCPSFLGYDVVTNAGVTVPQWTLDLLGDYSQYFSGGIRFYGKTFAAGDAGLAFTVEIADSTADLGVSSDTYDLEFSQEAPDSLPYTIDLTQAPSSVTGGGWGKATTGMAVRIELSAPPTGQIGFSTFDLFENFEEVGNSQVIKAYCLDGLSLNRTHTLVESPCKEVHKYSDEAIELSFTIQSETPDIYELQPNTVVEEGLVPSFKTAKRTAQAFTDPNTGANYARVTLPSITSDVCAPLDVLVTSQCVSGGPRILKQLTVDSPNQEIQLDMFYVARGLYDSTITNAILLHPSYVGEEVCVDYYDDVNGRKVLETDEYQNVEIELYLNSRDSDGKIKTTKFPAAFVTTLNDAMGKEDAKTIEATFQIPARNGRFLETYTTI